MISRIRERLSARPTATRDDATGDRAAVAAILEPSAGEVLLIRRAERAGDLWSGHMAFPGGRRDALDGDLVGTAVRETLEEIGLDLDRQGELLGRLPDVPAYGRGRATGLVVAPFVYALRGPAALRPNGEVAEIVWAPLLPMMTGELATEIDYPYEGETLRLPGHKVGERIVWGLTHRMLELLFDELR